MKLGNSRRLVPFSFDGKRSCFVAKMFLLIDFESYQKYLLQRGISTRILFLIYICVYIYEEPAASTDYDVDNGKCGIAYY